MNVFAPAFAKRADVATIEGWLTASGFECAPSSENDLRRSCYLERANSMPLVMEQWSVVYETSPRLIVIQADHFLPGPKP